MIVFVVIDVDVDVDVGQKSSAGEGGGGGGGRCLIVIYGDRALVEGMRKTECSLRTGVRRRVRDQVNAGLKFALWKGTTD